MIQEMTKAHQENADVGREIVRKIGIQKTIEIIGAEVVDTFETKTGGKYELLNVDYNKRGKRPFLKMVDPSCGEIFILGVKPGTTTCKNALAFLNNLNSFEEGNMKWEA